MNEPERTWLTADEFLAETERKRAELIARRQMPQPIAPQDSAVVYQLKPDLKYRPNKLDSTGYPGKVVYRRTTIEAHGRGGGARRSRARQRPGLVKSPYFLAGCVQPV